jgi:biotin synthase
MSRLNALLRQDDFSRQDIIRFLSTVEAGELELISQAADRTLVEHCSEKVYLRGLIEFSNICAMDCLYCGLRKNNKKVNRYCLKKEEIVAAASECAAAGFGSLVLQSGERRDAAFIDFVADVVREIKKQTVSNRLPEGLGITLCVGEHSPESYRRFFEAGAHRYLLRIETSSPGLFRKIHPPRQVLDSRLRCLEVLKEIGYQVGTGVMIGLPGQTVSMLADDILFFKKIDIDMIGMGPYICHQDTPMTRYHESVDRKRDEIFRRSLLMIAAARLVLKDVNIAATTALEAMDPLGREKGVRFGANVIMPQLTPAGHCGDYLIYPGKPCVNEGKTDCRIDFANRIRSLGRTVALDQWGDPKHFFTRTKKDAGGNPASFENMSISI